MENIAQNLITSDFDEKYVNEFLQAQKENPQKTEIEVLNNALEMLSVHLKDNNYSIETLKSELNKISKLISFFTDSGFQYSVEHTKNYLSQIPEYSFETNKKIPNIISEKFPRELRTNIKEYIAKSYCNPLHYKDNNTYDKYRKNIILIVSDFYITSSEDYEKNLIKNIDSYYQFSDKIQEKTNKPKM